MCEIGMGMGLPKPFGLTCCVIYRHDPGLYITDPTMLDGTGKPVRSPASAQQPTSSDRASSCLFGPSASRVTTTSAVSLICADQCPTAVQEAAKHYVTEGTEQVDAALLEQSKVYMQYANACYYIQVSCCPPQGLARTPV